MPRYAAFLRGVSPTNAKMPELRKAFEAAGFTEVKTVLSSGNVVFNARRLSESSIQRTAEAAMRERLGPAFLTIVRPMDGLREILASDPYGAFRLSPSAKRIVTFLRDEPKVKVILPLELEGARLLSLKGGSSSARTSRAPRGPSSCR
jgi:uncharacterized protein (DUF1697 family)